MLSSKAFIAAQPVAGKPQTAGRQQRRRSVVLAQAGNSNRDKIYIGFAKEDTASREGRQGRFINDDPKRYPGRDNMFTGGWAGGEAGLQQFVEGYKKEKANPPPSSPLRYSVISKGPKPLVPKGKDPIYIGFGKSDLDSRKAIPQGRVIKDDARRYPRRDNTLTGGFAGGELGLKVYVDKGDVPIAEPGSKRRLRQQSPLIVAGVVSAAATVGGLLLSPITEALTKITGQ